MPAPSRHAQHVVHFYRDERDFCALVSAFILEGTQRQQRPVLLTTQHHWRLVCTALTASGHGHAAQHATFVDADALIGDIPTTGRIDTTRCMDALEAAVTTGNQPVRIFGDVVTLLAERGSVVEALELEQLGHRLSETHGIEILCACDLQHLDPSGRDIPAIASAHHRAVPDLPKGPPHGPVVLLADDYEDTRDLYFEYLMANGYRVLTAGSGQEAIEVARTWRPDLILMDIRMPDISGVDAMRILKQDGVFAKVPIVAFTANARESARSECLAAGFDAVLVKPCLPDSLLTQIATLRAAAA